MYVLQTFIKWQGLPSVFWDYLTDRKPDDHRSSSGFKNYITDSPNTRVIAKPIMYNFLEDLLPDKQAFRLLRQD